MIKYRFIVYIIILILMSYYNYSIEAAEINNYTQNHFNSQKTNYSNNNFKPTEIIVRINPNTSIEQFNKFSKNIGALSISPIFQPNTPSGQHPTLKLTYLLRFPNNLSLDKIVQECAENVFIDAIELNILNRSLSETVPNDPQYQHQWNLKEINLPRTWNIETGRSTTIIAVVDSGIEMEHPEFQNQLWKNSGEIPQNGIDDDNNGYVDDVIGWDFTDAPTLPGRGDWTDRDNQPDDETGHGTHVSGIIAAEANNGIGIAGIAWNCRLMPLRAGFRIGAGSFLQNDDVAAAIVYAADNGADVINLSLGDTVNSFLMKDAVDYAYNRGCLIVAASGNASEPGSYYPAALNNVLSVAALDRDLQLGGTNFGASIDIAAPGEDILSTFLFDESLSDPGYIYLSGTSMAAAHVSGVAALLISANPSCTNIQAKQWLINTARQLSITNIVGAGLIDAYASITENIGLIAHLENTQITKTNKTIQIVGSAGGTEFSQYWFEYGITETPELWFPIGLLQTQPINNNLLYEWNTTLLEEGIYTLRLSVKGNSGKTIRDKIVIEIIHTQPIISNHEASVWLSENRFDSTIIWQTDVLTTSSIEVFERTDGDAHILENPFRIAFSDSVNYQHIVYLSDLGLPSGEYYYRLKTKNRTGITYMDDNESQLYTIPIYNHHIPPHHLQSVSSLKFGIHATMLPKDINGNGNKEIVGIETSVTNQQLTHFLEIDNAGNLKVIETLDPSISISRIWAAADTDADGLIELLCNVASRTFLLEQPELGKVPSEIIWNFNGIWGGTIGDLDADGKPEILSRHDDTNAIRIHQANGNNIFSLINILENPTQGKNRLGTRLATGDFDGDGNKEIIAGDNDGDVFIYEIGGPDNYHHTWTDKLSNGIPHLFASGDLNGDSIPEIAVGAKVWTTDFDLPRQHWLFTIYTSYSNDAYQVVWQQRIRQLRDEESGITISDANNDGKNELCIATPPNFYLIQYDGLSYQPIWYHKAYETFNPVVADLENDGMNELLFNTDEGFTIFKNPYSIGNPKEINAPWGLSARAIDERTVFLEWQSEKNVHSYNIYRGLTQETLKPIYKGIIQTDFTDTGLVNGTTYWYAIESQNLIGNVSNLSKPVSVTPTIPPKLTSAKYMSPNQVIIIFSKQMNNSASNSSRYKLHLSIGDNESRIETISPQSAILDRTGKRVILTFSNNAFDVNNTYRVETVQLSDISGAEILGDERFIDVDVSMLTTTDVVVYPNPVRDNIVTFDNLPASSRVYIYDVSGNCVEILNPTHADNIGGRCKIIWSMDGISSGVYVYVIKSDLTEIIGKFSVLK